MGKLTSNNPYLKGPDTFKTDPDIISDELSKSGSKAKARYPSGMASVEPGGGPASGSAGAGNMKRRAYTPGGPSGS